MLIHRTTALYKNKMVLHVSHGAIEILGNFTMLFSEVPDMSKVSWREEAGTLVRMPCLLSAYLG